MTWIFVDAPYQGPAWLLVLFALALAGGFVVANAGD